MSDARSNRKAKVIPFIDRLEYDRRTNLHALVNKAKLMSLEGFESIDWDNSVWQINTGRLVRLTGKNSKTASFTFSLSPKLGSEPLDVVGS